MLKLKPQDIIQITLEGITPEYKVKNIHGDVVVLEAHGIPREVSYKALNFLYKSCVLTVQRRNSYAERAAKMFKYASAPAT